MGFWVDMWEIRASFNENAEMSMVCGLNLYRLRAS